MKLYELKKEPELTASVAVFRETPKGIEVLLGKREHDPEAGKWCLPGGHADAGETSLAAAIRELEEETGLKLRDLTLVAERPSNSSRSVVDVCYAAKVDPDVKVKAGSDSLAVKWVNVGKLPDLAFEHEQYIYDALGKIFGVEKAVEESISDFLLTEERKLISLKAPTTKGTLIVFEGIDGAGKSTQIKELVKWLEENHHKVFVSRWNSSDVVKVATDRAKDRKVMTPMLFSLLNAADMIYRYDTEVLPALTEGKIVICDRYCYTSRARDGARGVSAKLLDEVYKQFREPDMIFYCHVPIETALKRLGKPSYYEAGMDISNSKDYGKSFLKYQGEVDRIYRSILPKKKTNFINTDQEPKQVFAIIKDIMGKHG